jgi:plasmid stability protein
MANLTISIDDALLQAARIRAVKEGTSVNEVCRRAIEAYAGKGGDRLARYRALRERIDAEPRPTGRRAPAVKRDQLYEELFSERRGGKAGDEKARGG